MTHENPLDHYLNRLINAVVHVGNEITRLGNLIEDDETRTEHAEEAILALLTIAERLEEGNDIAEASE